MNEESEHYHKKPHSEVSLHSLWNSTNGLTNFDYQLKQLTASVEQLQANQPSAKKLSKLGKGVIGRGKCVGRVYKQQYCNCCYKWGELTI